MNGQLTEQDARLRQREDTVLFDEDYRAHIAKLDEEIAWLKRELIKARAGQVE